MLSGANRSRVYALRQRRSVRTISKVLFKTGEARPERIDGPVAGDAQRHAGDGDCAVLGRGCERHRRHGGRLGEVEDRDVVQRRLLEIGMDAPGRHEHRLPGRAVAQVGPTGDHLELGQVEAVDAVGGGEHLGGGDHRAAAVEALLAEDRHGERPLARIGGPAADDRGSRPRSSSRRRGRRERSRGAGEGERREQRSISATQSDGSLPLPLPQSRPSSCG